MDTATTQAVRNAIHDYLASLDDCSAVTARQLFPAVLDAHCGITKDLLKTDKQLKQAVVAIALEEVQSRLEADGDNNTVDEASPDDNAAAGRTDDAGTEHTGGEKGTGTEHTGTEHVSGEKGTGTEHTGGEKGSGTEHTGTECTSKVYEEHVSGEDTFEADSGSSVKPTAKKRRAERTDSPPRHAKRTRHSKESMGSARRHERTPKEKTPKEKTPKEKTPKEKTPKEKTPKEKTPKEKTPKEKTPKEKTPREKDSASKKRRPTEDAKETPEDRLRLALRKCAASMKLGPTVYRNLDAFDKKAANAQLRGRIIEKAVTAGVIPAGTDKLPTASEVQRYVRVREKEKELDGVDLESLLKQVEINGPRPKRRAAMQTYDSRQVQDGSSDDLSSDDEESDEDVLEESDDDEGSNDAGDDEDAHDEDDNGSPTKSASDGSASLSGSE